MVSIFPPHGPQDEARCRSLKSEERDYILFCLEFCSEILLKRPEQIEALEMAANHFTALGYYTDGLLLDQRLAMLRPRDPGVLYNLACSFALIGRADDAILTLSRAVQHGYADHKHMADDRDLSSLRGDARFGELLNIMAKKH
jgi:hypothetical protein